MCDGQTPCLHPTPGAHVHVCMRARACMRVYDAYPSATHTHTTPRQAPESSCARAQAASSSWIRTSPTACQRPRSLHSTAPASALSGSSSCTPSAAMTPRAAGPQRTRLSAALSGAPPRNLARRRRRSSAPSGNADVSSGRWFTCARTPGWTPNSDSLYNNGAKETLSGRAREKFVGALPLDPRLLLLAR